jgi:hypothetical protein
MSYRCTTKKQIEKRVRKMLEELVFGFWLALGAYVFWYFVKAKDFQPMMLDELALTWRLHKHQTGCKSSCIHDLLIRNDEVVGFRCQCGHEYIQKRLITQKALVAPQFGTSFSFHNTSVAMKDMGISYLNLRRI